MECKALACLIEGLILDVRKLALEFLSVMVPSLHPKALSAKVTI
jgi:hypothetical protein